MSDDKVPAGWYPEAPGSAVERLWTGSEWTKQTRQLDHDAPRDPSAIAAQETSPPEEIRSDRLFSRRFVFTLTAVCLVTGGVLVSVLSSALGSVVSDACDLAGRKAVAANQAIYDKEGALLDELNADGIRTADEDARWSALYAQTSAEYNVTVLAPTFAECSSKDEWMAVAKRYPAFVGSTSADAVTESTLVNYCRGLIDTPVCVDAAAQGLDIPR